MASDSKLILPFFGDKINQNEYEILIPKLSKTLINTHLINEVNFCNKYKNQVKKLCLQRFEQDYFHTLKINFNDTFLNGVSIRLYKLIKIMYQFIIKDLQTISELKLEHKFMNFVWYSNNEEIYGIKSGKYNLKVSNSS